MSNNNIHSTIFRIVYTMFNIHFKTLSKVTKTKVHILVIWLNMCGLYGNSSSYGTDFILQEV